MSGARESTVHWMRLMRPTAISSFSHLHPHPPLLDQPGLGRGREGEREGEREREKERERGREGGRERGREGGRSRMRLNEASHYTGPASIYEYTCGSYSSLLRVLSYAVYSSKLESDIIVYTFA